MVANTIYAASEDLLDNNLATFAASDVNLDMYAQNNILFYEPSCTTTSSSGVCGDTAKEKYYFALLEYFDETHAIAALANIANEGGFGPTRWELGNVVDHDGGSFVVSWDDLYNGTYDGSYGVGAFAITSGLSAYLHYVNDNYPDLIQYFQDPTYSLPGEEALEAIGEDDFNKLVEMEVEYFINTWIDPSKLEGFKATTSLTEAAQYWAHTIEVCAACGYNGGSSELTERAKTAESLQEEVKDYSCTTSSDSSDDSSPDSDSTSSGLDIVYSAKNADKQYTDFPDVARWSDSDTSSMKKLLEAYGDLAYQLGKAVGAPYVAILVQMRYEDPDCVCGTNNFWGNGCDPSHAYQGGATIQGKNLGEGFVQYGETLTNGLYDAALGMEDPGEFLETIGPIWVNGDPNGAGYSLIEAMKSSADALQEYIDSPEGQAIVQEFGNYSGGSSDECVDECGTTMGGVTTVDIDGVTYAFPLAGASKSNYLNGDDGKETELSAPTSWYHHLDNNYSGSTDTGAGAVDLGIKASLAGYTEKTGSDYGLSDSAYSEMYYYSAGVPVVAITDGTITNYHSYSRAVDGMQEECASVTFTGNDGYKYWIGHMAWDDEVYQKYQNGESFEAGEKIGEVGAPSCAIGTQAHVHYDTSTYASENPDPLFMKDLIAKLYDALPEEGTSSTSSESSCGGSYDSITEEQAQKIATYYNTNYSSIGCCGLKNCVEFSIFFVSELTTKGTSGVNPTRGDGQYVAYNLVADGYAEGGNEPQVWSVFSTTAYHGNNHTGVVVGVNDDGTINTIEAAYPGWGDGYTEGNGNARVYMNQTPTSDMYFAYFKDSLNTTKLQEILSE